MDVCTFVCLLSVTLATPPAPEVPSLFLRADSNGDARVDLSDVIHLLNDLFVERVLECEDSGDSNDDGRIDISDAIFLLNFLFRDGAQVPAPGTRVCGIDPTEDPLGCRVFAPCSEVPCGGEGDSDGDGDAVCDEDDNCPGIFNPSQLDRDDDGSGDACEPLVLDDAIVLQKPDGGEENERDDRFGAALAAGDLDGDGFADLVVGCPGHDGDEGIVIVFPGEVGGFGPSFSLRQSDAGRSNENDDEFGASLAIGDFDADGYDDLAVGTPGENDGAGAVFTWMGSDAGLDLASGDSFSGEDLDCGSAADGDGFGSALAVGDFDGDSFDDLAIGSPGDDDERGAACIVRGRRGGLEAEGARLVKSDIGADPSRRRGDRFGEVLAAGDLDGLAGLDLAIGAPGAGTGEAGAVAVLFAAADAAEAGLFADGVVLTQEEVGGESETGELFARALGIGDLDGDGHGELVIGVPGETNGGPTRGAVVVVSEIATRTPEGVWLDPEPLLGDPDDVAADFGIALAVGDLDGDGRAEVVAGAPRGSASRDDQHGGIVVVFELSDGAVEVVEAFDQAVYGEEQEAGDRLGAALAVGDFNGDGSSDLALGAPGEAPLEEPSAGVVVTVPGSGASAHLTHGPLLVGVTDDSINVWARASREARFEVAFRRVGEDEESSVSLLLAADRDQTGVARLTGLAADSEYSYAAYIDGREAYRGTFRTLPERERPGSVRFVLGCDLNFVYRPFEILDAIRERRPHFMLSVGDNIYSDIPSVIADHQPAYEGRYRQTWSDPHFSSLAASVPFFFMWDDHEILDNWSAGKTGRYHNGRGAYEEYLGAGNPSPRVEGEIYYSFRAGEVDFYVLDTRTHRSPREMEDGRDKTMLGRTQREDLFRWLRSSSGKFKFIVSSVPFNDWSRTRDDAWSGERDEVGGFRTERDVLFDYIRENDIPGVVLLSGDQHWSGVFRLTAAAPYVLYEFLPSPLAIKTLRTTSSTDRQILFKWNESAAFGLFDVDTDRSPASLRFRLVDSEGTVQYELTITEDDVGR